ncbi:lysozyme C, milk isozyme-like [Saccostrea cucullata]|uniref:lysozyme C, milk isozyme-like n=1 Tax=Saccostrea cuccullata TaxID=36930 RepID=UPI002ED4A32F
MTGMTLIISAMVLAVQVLLKRDIVIIFFLAFSANGKTFGRCELAKELARNGVAHGDIDDYVCMAEYESGFDTHIRSAANSDGSHDHGIFQINDYWNCDPENGHTTKNGCNHPCSDFRNDDISDDISCVQQLKREHHGFGFSYAWRDHCTQIDSDYLRGCSY